MPAVIAPSPRRARPASHVPHSFFDPDAGQVATYDATNTRAHRTPVRTRCERAGFQVLFIEIRYDDPHIIEVNIRSTKRSSPEVAEELTYSRSLLPRARSTRASWSRSPSASRTCIPISSSL